MKDFEAFSKATPISPSVELSEKIRSQVSRDLDPSISGILSKVFLIHLMMGSFTLLFCPQFGIGLGDGIGLMALFMRLLGGQACMLGCGAFFMACGAFATSLLLRPEEMRKLTKSEVLWFPALSLFFMAAFVCAGGVFLLGIGAFWFIGSVVGGLSTLELGWLIRRRLFRSI